MDIPEALAEVDRLRAEIESVRPISPEQEARVLQKFRLEWNYHSNAIEGNSLTFGETKAFLMHGLTAKGKPFKDYLDIRGHDQVIDVLADIVRNEEELTEAAIRELHKILLGERYQTEAVTPDGIRTSRWIEVGRYKTTPNHVLTSTGKTYFFAAPEETPAQMADLIAWYREQRDCGDLHPVVLAALFHYRFVLIHPFDDGNGRMARILMNLILMQAGYLPVVLRLDKKSEYFLALEKADAGEQEDFVALIAEALIESETVYLKAARGESIDELEDFDKRLKLLRQVIETESGSGESERSQAAQNYVVTGFISTLYESIGARLVQLDPLFARSETTVLYMSGKKTGVLQHRPIHELTSRLAKETAALPVSTTKLFYHAHGFVKNAVQDFLCNLEVFFTPSSVSVQLHLTGFRKKEVFKAAYADLPGEDDARQVAKTVLVDLVTAFEKMASKKTD